MRKFERRLPVVFFLATVVIGPLTYWSCSHDDPEPEPVTPATIQALLVGKLDNVPGLGAALQRTITHLSGTPQPGVNIVPTATGGAGTVGVDLDNDGFQESTVTGTLTWNDPMLGFAGGAVLQITELTGNSVNMSSSLLALSPTQVSFSDISATVPPEDGRAQVTVSQGAITVDVSTAPPGLTGFVDFVVGQLPATMTLTSDVSGNLSILVQGDGFNFTVP